MLAVRLSAANTHDLTMLETIVDAVPSIRGRRGLPQRRPAKLHGTRGTTTPKCRRALRTRGITARIARRGIDASDRLGRYRWVVERTQAWLVGCRRLGLRYERRADILLAFALLAAARINLRYPAN